MNSARFVGGLTVSLVIACGATAAEPVRIRVEQPRAHAVIAASESIVTVRGVARGTVGRPPPLDLILVLDVSRSTRLASGVDVDGDGQRGEVLGPLGSTDPDDTVLHAEVAAARALLARLPANARLGVVSFSGESDPRTGLRISPTQRDAWLRAPVDSEHADVERALDQILEEGSHGATNFEAAIRTATQALASNEAEAPKRRAVLFLTDGLPSFPVGRSDVSDPGDVERASAAAREAAEADIRIHVFALGPDAVAEPRSATALARATGGSFVALVEPGQIIDLLPALSFEGPSSLVVRNLETGALAESLDLQPDGRFEARLSLVEGTNRIRVEAGRPATHLDVPIVFQPLDPGGSSRRSLEIRVDAPGEPEADPES
jgi:hypothetical protein